MDMHLVTSMQMANAAMGIMTELVRKSKKSRNGIPMMVIKESGPYPRQDSVPRATMTTAMIVVHLKRLHLNSSARVDTALSVSAMELVSAANSTSVKNRMPMMRPKPILLKICGIVMNIREGPAFKCSGSPPEKANTAGMIIMPARIAIAVSKNSTWRVESSILTSFFM